MFAILNSTEESDFEPTSTLTVAPATIVVIEANGQQLAPVTSEAAVYPDCPWFDPDWVRDNPDKSCPAAPVASGIRMTTVDITEEDAEYQEALRLKADPTITPVASFWHWLG